MVVQAAAIERMIERDPEAAKAGAAQLRVQGKETLNGLRSVVGLLRTEGEIAQVAGLQDLPELIDSTRALGTQATFRRTGDVPQLAPIVDAAVYRIAQQALSNAVQHAPGAAITVELNVTPEELIMAICNGPAPRPKEPGYRSGGTGTVVMAERASLIGAQLEAGPTSTHEIAETRHDGTPAVLVVTTFDLDTDVFGALEAGADGFILKDCEPEELVDAVRRLAAGYGLVDQAVTRRVIAEFARRRAPATNPDAAQVLTPRETDIVRLLAEGMSNAEIAEALFVETSTVKSHLTRVMTKIGTRDRVQTVVWAYRNGLVGLD